MAFAPPVPTAPVLIADCRAILGEGPVWVAAEQALYWVDIKGCRIFCRDSAGAITEWATPWGIGSIAPRLSGGFIAGTELGLAAIDLASGRFDILVDPEPDRAANRFNDGKVDRHGRFWAGTMDDGGSGAPGALYRLGHDLVHATVDDGYRVTNGPAFSRDGTAMYHTDSAARTIWLFDLDAAGNAAGKRVFAQFTTEHGHPDGMTVDADDCLWIAFWDGWCIRRLSPAGEILTTIDMPVQRPTSVAFGGTDLDRLFVTSARIGLDEDALAAQPHAGGLFMLEPGVTGLAEIPFGDAAATGGDHR